jgi:hypothetical protein
MDLPFWQLCTDAGAPLASTGCLPASEAGENRLRRAGISNLMGTLSQVIFVRYSISHRSYSRKTRNPVGF